MLDAHGYTVKLVNIICFNIFLKYFMRSSCWELIFCILFSLLFTVPSLDHAIFKQVYPLCISKLTLILKIFQGPYIIVRMSPWSEISRARCGKISSTPPALPHCLVMNSFHALESEIFNSGTVTFNYAKLTLSTHPQKQS